MSERLNRWPEIMVGASKVMGASIGFLAIRDWQDEQQQERFARAEELTIERNEWYAGADGLMQSAINRDVFMASLPEGCDDAMKPFYFDSASGRDVEPRDVVASIEDKCDIGPYDVVVARETMNNIARLFTIIEGLDKEIDFNQNYRLSAVEKHGERIVGGAFGAGAGFILPLVGVALYDSARRHIARRRHGRLGTRTR